MTLISKDFPKGLPRDTQVLQALQFASEAHAAVGQLRKYVGTPYIEHPIEVAELVYAHTGDKVATCAALLHDVIEDTNVTYEAVVTTFGLELADLVLGLTDVSRKEDGNRSERKALDRLHVAWGGTRVHSVKLADLISNTRSIAEHDPKFARVYLEEKRLLLPVLKRGAPSLQALAFETLQEGEALLVQHHLRNKP